MNWNQVWLLKTETPPKSLHFLILSFFFGEEILPVKEQIYSVRKQRLMRERERESFHISPHQSPPNFNFLYLALIQELFISKPYFSIISNNRI
jgi:hypothetical protein